MGAPSQLSPTFYGHISSTHDALILFEACLGGLISHVARRPHDRERAGLIQSGNVFIYEEHSSGIKRWTDGVPWSPSRILGNFLVYRELDRPFPPGEKKRAMKRSKRPSPSENRSVDLSGGVGDGYGLNSGSASSYEPTTLNKGTERSLIGSLVDSYGFKDNGLVKKTVSVTVEGVSHHLVSYYTVADILNNKFITPSKDPRFQNINIRPDLVTKQNFRTPIQEQDPIERPDDQTIYNPYPQSRSGYEMTNQSMAQRSMSLPMLPVIYGGNHGVPSNNYYIPPSPTTYSPASYTGSFGPAAPPYPVKSDGFAQGNTDFRYPRYLSDHTNRSAMPPPAALSSSWSSRRNSSVYDESTVSALSPTSMDSSKYAHDSGYSSFGSLPQDYSTKRFLPSPHALSPHDKPSYDRPATHSYSEMDHSATKDNSWPMTHPSVSNAQYITPQVPWASSGYHG